MGQKRFNSCRTYFPFSPETPLLCMARRSGSRVINESCGLAVELEKSGRQEERKYKK